MASHPRIVDVHAFFRDGQSSKCRCSPARWDLSPSHIWQTNQHTKIRVRQTYLEASYGFILSQYHINTKIGPTWDLWIPKNASSIGCSKCVNVVKSESPTDGFEQTQSFLAFGPVAVATSLLDFLVVAGSVLSCQCHSFVGCF